MRRYDCFILRVWRSHGEHGEQWAGRLEHVSGGETLRFGDPDALLRYLCERIARGDGRQRAQPGRDTPRSDLDGRVGRLALRSMASGTEGHVDDERHESRREIELDGS